MKKLLLTLALVLMVSPASAQLIMTGLYDGPLPYGVPKGVELYACSDIEDLSVYGLGSANNDGGTDGIEHVFPADFVAAGTFIYVSHVDGNNPTAFFDFFGFDYTYQGDGYSMAINGDDAVELFYIPANGDDPVVVDVFGEVGVDGSGHPWEYLDGWAKRTSMTGPDGNVFDISSWTFSGPNAWDGELTNDGAAVPMVLGGFSCDPAVSSDNENWGSLKSMYR
ncbi:MAG: hypothetical protein KOO60_04570 [Gemmatimonadales bacterium]|nr:hypothetical protein [Gemmatimonadales bacterium]